MKDKLDRRDDARIRRSALDEVRSIQALLADVYKDAGDGRTLLRELVQNADDARASRLVFVVLNQGWAESRNSLLRGAGLVAINDGAFTAKDRDALHQAIGGSKAEDAEKIGRFGIGLKSVFHICEAIVYVGAEDGIIRPGALNPWAGTGLDGTSDPLHPDWNEVVDEDVERLTGLAAKLLGQFDKGLLLWIPLRCAQHRDRADGRPYGLGQTCPSPIELRNWFGSPESLNLLLAQCGHLHSIEAETVVTAEEYTSRTLIVRVIRPGFESGTWVGRHRDDLPAPDRHFQGHIENGQERTIVVGAEFLGLNSLSRQRSQVDWPLDLVCIDGQYQLIPRKALAHAAITILHTHETPSESSGVRLRWAVFLPLDDDPQPRQSSVVETVGSIKAKQRWEIILHGYFWPSQDRRSIPGVTDHDAGTGDNEVRVRWNRAVRDELLLPGLPGVLAVAVREMPESESREIVRAISESRVVRENLDAVTLKHLLLPLVTENGVNWHTCDSTCATILTFPAWSQAPENFRKLFPLSDDVSIDGVVFVAEDAPRIGGNPAEWPVQWLDRLLKHVPIETFQTPNELIWVARFVRHVHRGKFGGEDERAKVVAEWLAQKIADGALSPTMEAKPEERDELRAAWRQLFETLPESWLFDVPVECQRAVVELAADGIIGARFIPIPFGYRPAISYGSRPDPDLLDRALSILGRRLEVTDGVSQRAQRSRILFAEKLLEIRGNRPLTQELARLPLLRARRLPDDKDEGWSVDHLRQKVSQFRVFTRQRAQEETDDSIDSPSDPKQAILDLAIAISEDVWLVDTAVASAGGVALPTAEVLAQSVLRATAIRSGVSERSPLLKRLSELPGSPLVHRAVRLLLTGRDPGNVELFYIRGQDSNRESNRQTLEILLRLLDRTWCAVESEVIDPLPHALVQRLNVRAVDPGVLFQILGECVTSQVNWNSLNQSQAVHLVRQLFGTTEFERQRWRQMPLHRGVDGNRDRLEATALRAVGTIELPAELHGEIRLLAPDREVADLYQEIPTVSREGLLHAIVLKENPQRFADRIVQLLLSDSGNEVVLPSNKDLRDQLKTVAWLPCRDGSVVSPEHLLTVPSSMDSVLAPLAASGALGDFRLSDSIDSSLWNKSEKIVTELMGRLGRTRQVERVAYALDLNRKSRANDGEYEILPDAGKVSFSTIGDALETTLVDQHLGWGVVKAAATAVGVSGKTLADTPQPAIDAVLSISRSLCGPIQKATQVRILTALSDVRPGKDSPAGRLYRTFLEIFSRDTSFFEDILPHIMLPTQDGKWNNARDIARSASGVAKRHRVVSDLRSYLLLDTEESVRQEPQPVIARSAIVDTATQLRKYFEPWTGRVPGGAVGGFLSLLGNGTNGAISRLAQQWLGDDVSVDGMHRELFDEANFPTGVRLFFSGNVASGQHAEVLNLLGARVTMEIGTDCDTIFSADPERLDHWRGDFWSPQSGDVEPGSSRNAGSAAMLPFWSLNLRDAEPQSRTAHELVAMLGGAVEWWAVRVLKLDRTKVDEWWSRWGTGSQAQVGPVQASILANLPRTLRDLNIRDCEPLRDALRKAETAQRKREQSQTRDAITAEREALDHLAALIRDEAKHQQFLWERVQELMRRFGYRADSVLLELVQNADDALAQLAEISGKPLPPEVRRIVVRVQSVEGAQTIDVTHYGRPINDTGGTSFPAGRDREWDQDLYFMMLLNLSGKPGEIAGQATTSSTTGRFGLGFKSVHLVSPKPQVVSGFLAFSIAGGLLPIEQPVPNDPDLMLVQDHRATRIRLPLRNDIDASPLVKDVFHRFHHTRALLPVFARQLREIAIDGGPFAGLSVFDGRGITDAPGWSVGLDTTELPGSGRWRVLRYRPSDAGGMTGTAAVAIGLRDYIPASFPHDLPFLWNVTPTSEGWGCGYAVNGPFKLDPGRTHVSLDDAATVGMADMLGEALGTGLVDLHDALVGSNAQSIHGLPTRDAAHDFLASLWTVLASGLDSPDGLRHSFLSRLHGNGRGLSSWMCSRAVVPTGLASPFAKRLPPLTPDMKLEVAAGNLADANLCHAFARIPELATIAESHLVVSSDVAQHLSHLFQRPVRRLLPEDILTELINLWDHQLTPPRLRALRPLAGDSIWELITASEQPVAWNSRLIARSANGTPKPLRSLLFPRTASAVAGEADVEEELLRSAFAPASSLLDAAYIETSDDLMLFLRLRHRHEVSVAEMAAWCADVSLSDREAALTYLLRGKRQQDLLQLLVPLESRPTWLTRYDYVLQMLDSLGEEEWRCRQLLAALFPEQFLPVNEISPPAILPESTTRGFFDNFLEWWNNDDDRSRVIERYEEATWPDWLRQDCLAESLQSGSDDHWLGLLILGACRSLGRTEGGHHRAFLEWARSEGLWDVFRMPDDTRLWMERLRNWQDNSVANLKYSRWMSLFPAIHQLSRYIAEYKRLLRTAGRRPEELYRVTSLLAPRVDEALTGAGQQFDAPPAPLNMGLHWILRELVRLRVVDGQHIFPDCWVPSDRLLRFLFPLGLEQPDAAALNAQKARSVSMFLASKLQTPNPHLHRAFDIPILYLLNNSDQRRRLGLEQ
jgi:hypothetical protein